MAIREGVIFTVTYKVMDKIKLITTLPATTKKT